MSRCVTCNHTRMTCRSCFDALAASVAKLEARQPTDWREQPDGMPIDSPRGGTDQPSPPDAGVRTTVQGGGACGVLAGWKLAPGWSPSNVADWCCTWRWELNARCRRVGIFESGADGACADHAVEMGAIVREVAEQPASAADELHSKTRHHFNCGHPSTADEIDACDKLRVATPEPASRQGEPLSGWLRMTDETIALTVDAARKRVEALASDFAPPSISAEVLLHLHAKLAAAERDEEARRQQYLAALERAEKAERERDEARKDACAERERCLYWAESCGCNFCDKETETFISAIRNGMPEPKGPTE